MIVHKLLPWCYKTRYYSACSYEHAQVLQAPDDCVKCQYTQLQLHSRVNVNLVSWTLSELTVLLRIA